MQNKLKKVVIFLLSMVLILLIATGCDDTNDYDETMAKIESNEAIIASLQNKGADAQENAETNNGASLGENNALQAAQDYIEYSGFSYKGLIEQLEYEGYTKSEATYGADNCNVDWNEEASETAKNYMDYSSFSQKELIEQLKYEGFTEEQAKYGAKAVGY